MRGTERQTRPGKLTKKEVRAYNASARRVYNEFEEWIKDRFIAEPTREYDTIQETGYSSPVSHPSIPTFTATIIVDSGELRPGKRIVFEGPGTLWTIFVPEQEAAPVVVSVRDAGEKDGAEALDHIYERLAIWKENRFLRRF